MSFVTSTDKFKLSFNCVAPLGGKEASWEEREIISATHIEVNVVKEATNLKCRAIVSLNRLDFLCTAANKKEPHLQCTQAE